MNTVCFRQACLEEGIELGDLEPMGVQLAGMNTTGAAPFRPERWNDYALADGSEGYQYQVASGDTLSALAALYLDNAQRWNDIWTLQAPERTVPGSPDQIFVDEWLEMPAEAGDKAKAWNGGTLPGSGGGLVAPPPPPPRPPVGLNP